MHSITFDQDFAYNTSVNWKMSKKEKGLSTRKELQTKVGIEEKTDKFSRVIAFAHRPFNPYGHPAYPTSFNQGWYKNREFGRFANSIQRPLLFNGFISQQTSRIQPAISNPLLSSRFLLEGSERSRTHQFAYYIRAGKLMKALLVFRQMEQQRIATNEIDFFSLIDLLVQKNQIRSAKKLLCSRFTIEMKDRMLDFQELSHGAAYLGLLIFMASTWDKKHSFKVITRIDRVSPNKVLYGMRDFLMAKLEEKHPPLGYTIYPHEPKELHIFYHRLGFGCEKDFWDF